MNLKNKQGKITFPFETVRDLLNNLDKEWPLSQDLLLLARKLKKELLTESYETYLIHGDLHRENILSHANSWVVIDPKGYIGSLYNEVWPFIHAPEIEIPFIAKKLGLETEKLTKWCFVHGLLAATWCLEDRINPNRVLNLVSKLLKMLDA